MSGIDNTTSRMKDPAEMMLFLAEAMAGGPDAPIKRQERDGQRQLVNSEMLPTDHGDDTPWLALGFTFGSPDKNDPLFQPATLPEGWHREGGNHAMWSYLLDQHGRQRVGIFYKAAFYDRSAHMHLESLDWYVTKHVEYDGPLVITDEWATRDTVTAALARLRDHELSEARKYRACAAEDGRDEDNRAALTKIATRNDETAAKYAAKLAELTAGGAA